jgi:rare lipoprotein A
LSLEAKYADGLTKATLQVQVWNSHTSDPHGKTAAHRTLPFGTRLTVTNPKTDKSVIVVVNDRGSSTRRIDIDLSIAAAKAIGPDGAAAVSIE